MFQTLYVLAGIFLVVCLVFWILGAIIHTLFWLVWAAFHLLFPIAVVIFIIGLIKHMARRT